MQIAAAALFAVVCKRLISVRTKIVAEREVLLDLPVSSLKAVQLDEPASADRIVPGAVPAVHDSVFSPPFVAQVFESRFRAVQSIKSDHFGQKIEDRLGADTWYRCGTDVANRKEIRTESGRNSVSLLAGHPCPIAAVRNEFDLDWRGHGAQGNWRKNRTSFWKSSGSSVTPYFIIASRSMPMPKAKPECFAAS
jgi:hypothetical protein